MIQFEGKVRGDNMKTDGRFNFALTWLFAFLLFISYCGCRQIGEWASSSRQLKGPKEDRLKYLERLHLETYKRARSELSHGQYAEAISSVEKVIATLKQSDYDDFPGIVGSFYFLSGKIAEMTQLEMWKKAAIAYEKALDIEKSKADCAGSASNTCLALGHLYHSAGAHEKAEQYHLKAVAFANGIETEGECMAIESRKNLLMFYRQHGKEKQGTALARDLEGLMKNGKDCSLSDKEIGEMFGDRAEKAIEGQQIREDELKRLIEEK